MREEDALTPEGRLRPPGFVAALARELARLRARPWDMVVLTVLPLAFGALVAWIFAAGTPRDLPLLVLDADQSALSRQVARWIDAAPGVRTLAPGAVPRPRLTGASGRDEPPCATTDADACFAVLRAREAFGLVVIPAGFAAAVQTGRNASVQLFYNAQFSSHAGAVTQAVRGAVGTLSAGIEIVARQKRGAGAVQAQAQFEPVRVQLATLFNESLDYELFMGASLLPAQLQIAAMLAAVTAVGRELKDGSVPRWLAVAGGSWPVALAAKLAVPALAMAVLAGAYVLAFDTGMGYVIRGSALAIGAGLALLVAASLAMGVLLVAATLSFRRGLSLVAFYAGAAFAFSGQGFPLLAMPALPRLWAALVPLTHYLQLHNRHWLAGAPLSYAAGDLAALAAFVAVGGGIGGWLLARRADDPSAWGRP